MLDIRLIREQPDIVKKRLSTRGTGVADAIDEVLDVDTARRKAETAVQQLNAERKKLSKEIGGKRARGESADDLEARGRKIGDKIAELNQQIAALEQEQRGILLQIANLQHESAPLGKDVSAIVTVRTWGEKPQLDGPVLDHVA